MKPMIDIIKKVLDTDGEARTRDCQVKSLKLYLLSYASNKE
jgi:hypothetical protein